MYNKDKKLYILILYLIFTIIAIFMILVFIEIIQLNFWGLSTMTKKNIEERAKLDAVLNDDEGDNLEDGKEDNNEVDNGNKDINNDKVEKRITFNDYCIELKDLNY